MNGRWMAVLPIEEAFSLGILRLKSGIEVLEDDGRVWLRGTEFEEINRELRKVSGLVRFNLLEDRWIVPVGKSVPTGAIPDGKWIRLSDWIRCELPSTCWRGEWKQRIRLGLVPSTSMNDPSALMTTFETLERYVITAPQIRLDHLTFAVNSSCEAFVVGRPLPPVAGKYFVMDDGVAIQAGWQSYPSIDSATLKEIFLDQGGSSEQDGSRNGEGIVVVHAPDGEWEFIPSFSFVRVTRSAVRLTAESLHER